MIRILYADNAPEFLELRALFLERAGYSVVTAGGLEEARRALSDLHFHLAILDIRLVDDDDDRDTSGLTLAKDPAYHTVPKVVLTNYPTFEAVRDALGPAAEGLPPAVGFLAKQEGPEEMLRVVAEVLARHARQNWSLPIHWAPQAPAGFLSLAALLCRGISAEALLQRSAELENLFQKLFVNVRQVRVDPILWHSGERLCLSVAALSNQGTTDRRLLVVGARWEVAEEALRRREFAPPTSLGVRSDEYAETVHLAAVTYIVPDANLETAQSLSSLFVGGKDRRLGPAFAQLLGQVLPAWHSRGQENHLSSDLMVHYRHSAGLDEERTSRAAVEQRVQTIVQSVRGRNRVGVESDETHLTFLFPNEPPLLLPNPVTTVYSPFPMDGAEIVCRISPGRLTADNLLVDAQQRVWLTDFASAGPAPQWWDLVQLEAVVRFDLGQAPDLQAWWEFEERLAAPSLLNERLLEKGVEPELRSHLSRIGQIRLQACNETGPEVLPYYAGLLVWAVAAMADYDAHLLHSQSEQMRAAHLLLAAGLLARRLGRPQRAAGRWGPLRMEGDGTVWAGEQLVATLVGQELDLLRCLLEHPNELVGRREIAERVLGEPYSSDDPFQQNRIDSLVTRLRKDIEPDARSRRYVTTTRKIGYRLRPNGVERDATTSD